MFETKDTGLARYLLRLHFQFKTLEVTGGDLHGHRNPPTWCPSTALLIAEYLVSIPMFMSIQISQTREIFCKSTLGAKALWSTDTVFSLQSTLQMVESLNGHEPKWPRFKAAISCPTVTVIDVRHADMLASKAQSSLPPTHPPTICRLKQLPTPLNHPSPASQKILCDLPLTLHPRVPPDNHARLPTRFAE